MDEKMEIMQMLDEAQKHFEKVRKWVDANRQELKKDCPAFPDWDSFVTHFVSADWHLSSAIQHGYAAIYTERYKDEEL